MEIRSYNVYTANPNYDAEKSGPNRPYKNLRDDQVWLKIFIVGADHETGNNAGDLRIALGLRGKPIVITEAGHPFELAIKDDREQLETPFPSELIPSSSPQCTCVRDLRKGIRTGAVLQGLIEAGMELQDINRCWIQRNTPAFDGSETARDVLYIISNEGITFPAKIISSISSTCRSFRVTIEPGIQEFSTLFSILSLKEQISIRFRSNRRSSSAVTTYGRQAQGRERAGRGGPVMDYSFGSGSGSTASYASTITSDSKSYAMTVSSSTSNEIVLRQDRLELTLKSLENSNSELRNELKKKMDDNDTALRDLMVVQKAETENKLRSLQENIEVGLTSKLEEVMKARLESQDTSFKALVTDQSARTNSMLESILRSLGLSPGIQTQPLVMAELAPSLPPKLVSDAQPLANSMSKSNQYSVAGTNTDGSPNRFAPLADDSSKSSQGSGKENAVPNPVDRLSGLARETDGREQKARRGSGEKKYKKKKGKGPPLNDQGQGTVDRFFTPPVCLTEANFSPSAETWSSTSALEGSPSLAREIFTEDCSSISDSEYSHGHNTRSMKTLLSGVKENVRK